MKKSYLVMVLVAAMSLFLLSACGEDGDGKIVMKEPKRELSEIPERKSWFDTPISQQPQNGSQD